MSSLLLAPTSVVVYESAGVVACVACFSPCQESEFTAKLERAGLPFAVFIAGELPASGAREATAVERAVGHALPHSQLVEASR